MINFTVHNIEEIKVEKTGKIFEGSHCRTIRIKTSEVDVVEIYLFAAKSENLEAIGNGR